MARVSEANAATVRQAFAPGEVDEALAVLALFGDASWHRGVDRVHAAILQLAAGDLDALWLYADAAYRDWRDVLWWASGPPPGPAA